MIKCSFAGATGVRATNGRPYIYTDIQLKTFIHGMEVFNMKIIMRRNSVILSKSRNRLRQRRNLSD